ncbi:MAG: hypothetical protein JSU63_20835 [Phycisphaerales bacterium]|nr:MAG: hypothetical protein JSU63_20835 [Phycisphaerales bacterium]
MKRYLSLIALALTLPLLGGDDRNHPLIEGSNSTWVESQSVSPPQYWTPSQRRTITKALAEKRDKLVRKQHPRFDQPAKAQEFFMQQRRPRGETDLPVEDLYAELTLLKAREKALAEQQNRGPRSGGITEWNSLGPGNIGGRTRAIVIDPANPDTMFAAGVTGGIWKSTNAGASWQVTDDFLPNLAVSTIAMHPTNPSILYAGTGEGVFGSWVKHRGLGIFKSVDAGATWDLLTSTVQGVPEGSFYFVNKIVISPNDSNRIYAATMFGVWRSLDAGQTWSVVLRNPWALSSPIGIPATNGCSVGCTDLAVRADTFPDVLLAAFGSAERDGLYRSEDGGDTWTEFETAPEQGRMTLAIAPSDNDRMYILMAQNHSGSWGKLYSVFRSDDGGDSWYSSLNFDHRFSEWLLSYVAIATGCYEHPVIYSQGWYDNIIAVDPLDPDVVWVGGIDLYRSDDGAQTFGLAGYWFFYLDDPVPPTYIHPDNHAVTFHPEYDGTTNQTMYVGNDGGIFKTVNARAATTQDECAIAPDPGPPPDIAWQSCNHGYGVTQYYHGDSAVETDMFVAGSQDNGTSQALAVDTPDGWAMIYGGDGGYVAIDPTNSQRLFIEIQGFPQIRVSNDGGETSELAVDGITDTDGLFITPFVMDQSNPDVLWTGGGRPWRTTDGAVLWEPAGPNFAAAGRISAIAIAPSDSQVVYIGYENGYIARTSNGLDSSPDWMLYTDGLYNGGWISSIAVDPNDPDLAFCTYSTYGIPHVLRKPHGREDWVPINGTEPDTIPDIPAHWIAVRPCDTRQLYVATELGVFASDDEGASWTPVNTGLAHTIVETLDFKNQDTLVAFTHGRGAFIAEIEPCGVPEFPALSGWGVVCMTLLAIVPAILVFARGRRDDRVAC